MSRPSFLQIDLAALKHNAERVRALAPRSKMIAMVKANAYGHGLVGIASALAAADALGVASIDEAIVLREAGITQPIVLIEGVFFESELEIAAHYKLHLIVHHISQLEMLEKTRTKYKFTVWLKINTGMHRLGIPVDQVNLFYQRLMSLDLVNKPIGLMTHFAEADGISSAATSLQLSAFNQATTLLAGPRSLANSAGILAWPETHADWVRPGLMLYGASPFAGKTGQEYDLKPVMTLRSKLIAIQAVKKGGKVGYGGTWTAQQDTSIGVVAVGYGDGYPQGMPNGSPVLVNGKECPLVGRVSMDMLTVDLQQQPGAAIDDSVVLWGEGLPVERIATCVKSSAYELLTRMTARLKREEEFIIREII